MVRVELAQPKSKWEFAMAGNLLLALLIYSILDDYFILNSKLPMRSMVNSEASIQTLTTAQKSQYLYGAFITSKISYGMYE
jgi:hypothetical protein